MSLTNKLWNSFITLYLFNKSDMKTIVAPVTVFSLALATTHSFSRFCYVVLWIWTLLLQVTVSNQSIGNSPEEDAINKPNRPIPSRRISLEAARLFRWLLIPIDLAVSVLLGAFPAGVCVSFMVAVYSEGRGHSHWFTKNLCCAFFYAAFEYGGTTVAEGTGDLSPKQVAAIIGSASIIMTTIHAQDFRDNEGDALRGRSTFTLAYPTIARISMPVTLIGWSIALYLFSEVNFIAKAFLVAMSIYVSARFSFLHSAKDDKWSYDLYNIWLSTAHYALSTLDVNLITAMTA
ncbi:hypothetical protein D9758_009086 [Tetrapyrgos nigripes]|uniref:Uncharacterized protein n=1 Tax=Tetrapyrgos nigripes TaxID=182062 RepID=A0A8H5LL46_9AGAR|nr:hypothetical protein D9758_009086 [Tetrapyrgos nigripes]